MAELKGNNPITAAGLSGGAGTFDFTAKPGRWYGVDFGGVFDGATVKLQQRDGSSADGDVTDSSATAPTAFAMLATRPEYRIDVTGAGASVNLKVRICEETSIDPGEHVLGGNIIAEPES